MFSSIISIYNLLALFLVLLLFSNINLCVCVQVCVCVCDLLALSMHHFVLETHNKVATMRGEKQRIARNCVRAAALALLLCELCVPKTNGVRRVSCDEGDDATLSCCC